jgi:predicted signal transduction protein with EAL and GGDEF domain
MVAATEHAALSVMVRTVVVADTVGLQVPMKLAATVIAGLEVSHRPTLEVTVMTSPLAPDRADPEVKETVIVVGFAEWVYTTGRPEPQTRRGVMI